MDDRLAMLLDERDIVAVIQQLFVATDRKDWAGVEGCFDGSVYFDMSSLGGGSPKELDPAEIIAGWKSGLAPIEAVHHQVGNFRVEVRGDEAEAFCYGIAFHHRRTQSGRNTRTFVGSYDFGLRRRPGGWKIHRFRYDAKFVDGNLELEKG